jgi:beta-xylosidase
MHMNPAAIVLHSKDLVNWELASYCMDRLDLGPAFRLEEQYVRSGHRNAAVSVVEKLE